ncbi:alpha/beta hydrolase [bacterium]|nr:MAG: alpha/beta hydrolase [bacterium]
MSQGPYLPDIVGSPLMYQERGEGPTLILVPGLDGTALLFYRQVPLLSRRFHVLTFPLPDDPACTMDSLVASLREVIDKIAAERGEERVLLCGESFGGALSLSFALAHPDRLRGLVILNSFPKIRKPFQLRVAPTLLRWMPWGAMPLVRRFTESRIHSPHALPEDLAEFHQRLRWVGKRGYIRRLEILRTYDITERLPEIETPALFLAGELDRLVPSVREAEFMSRRMPNASMVSLRGYGHVCMINHDFNLLDYILPWLEK